MLWLARTNPTLKAEVSVSSPPAKNVVEDLQMTPATATAAKGAAPGSRIRVVTASPEDGRIILPEVAEIARTLHRAENSALIDIETLQNLMDNYHNICGSLPFGLNHEIAGQLCGQNPKRYAVLPPDFAGLNANGELIDRWGTPYFFHALNSNKLEVRSAGPDKLLWSGDDVGEISTP